MTDDTKRPRGRPVGGRAFERSDVVTAALDAIAAGGYTGLTMRGVARSIGASLATVQRHFATKDELWRGAVDAFIDGFEQPDISTHDDVLQRGIEDLLGRAGEHPGLIATLFTDRAPGHEERFDHIAEGLAARHDATLAALAELQQAGTVREVDTRAFLLLLQVGLGAIASSSTAARDIYGFDLGDPEERLRLATALADILRLGIAAR